LRGVVGCFGLAFRSRARAARQVARRRFEEAWCAEYDESTDAERDQTGRERPWLAARYSHPPDKQQQRPD
jgi:hypothetical protein